MLEEKYNGGGAGLLRSASTRFPASDLPSPISWLLGSSQGDSHFASILVVESREMRVDLLCRCFDRLRNALKTRWL